MFCHILCDDGTNHKYCTGTFVTEKNRVKDHKMNTNKQKCLVSTEI